ncbi:hypothetical protein M885DRAFT_522239 [Pelagophyceae sp. CCMP2097]|nr:hypothetical protein M885DRAFT_522239 [Pelagophyceae sp. CCMP2097]
MRVISIVALLFASAAALAPVKTAVRPATKAPFKVALPAVAGAVVAQIPLAAFASDVDLSLVNLILPVGARARDDPRIPRTVARMAHTEPRVASEAVGHWEISPSQRHQRPWGTGKHHRHTRHEGDSGSRRGRPAAVDLPPRPFLRSRAWCSSSRASSRASSAT